MGMSASQGRLLAITARMSDNEFQATSIMQAKISLAKNSELLTKMYTKALDKKKLVFQAGFEGINPNYTDLSARMLTAYNPDSLDAQRLIKNKDGAVLVSSSDYQAVQDGDIGKFLRSHGYREKGETGFDEKQQEFYNNVKAHYTTMFMEILKSGAAEVDDADFGDHRWLHKALQSGDIHLCQYDMEANDGKGGFDTVSWQTGDNNIREVRDEEEIARATAEYETKLDNIERTDKMYDLDLQRLDTEHQTYQTEYDSVKKVIDKNIDESFKSLG